MNNFLSPSEIAEFTVNIGIKKANLSFLKQFLLGILAGAFIAFGAQAANIVSLNGSKFLAGLIFPTGLILVLIAGAELFTGNCLMVMSLFERKISLLSLLRSWFTVYIGNLAGGILIAFLISRSGLFNNEALREFTVKVALNKVSLSFENAFVLGVLCNWLVCLAVWISFAAKDVSGKILAIFFPIWLFITSGFEHSVANMYYIPAGIFLEIQTENLTWSSMFFNNLLPVTLGNIVGGAVFVGFVYYLIYRFKIKE